MTEWLIHFTRDVGGVTAREVLAKILIEGVLRAGFSVRGSAAEKTVYGPQAAVCFTEQPISAFLEYLAARRDRSAMAGYGIVIHKHDVYAAGGLPVIYALRAVAELKDRDPGYRSDRRNLRPELLPLEEQYRYVAFAPNRPEGPVDWTHEREWRWPASKSRIPGVEALSLGIESSSSDRGAFRARIHAFVDRDEDIAWLKQTIALALQRNEVGLLQTAEADDHTSFWRDRQLKKVRLISLETARRRLNSGNQAFARFEEWPESDKHPLI